MTQADLDLEAQQDAHTSMVLALAIVLFGATGGAAILISMLFS